MYVDDQNGCFLEKEDTCQGPILKASLLQADCIVVQDSRCMPVYTLYHDSTRYPIFSSRS